MYIHGVLVFQSIKQAVGWIFVVLLPEKPEIFVFVPTFMSGLPYYSAAFVDTLLG
jgi:hypothetical protein